jgi:uncharacterized protein (UPF0248 family)
MIPIHRLLARIRFDAQFGRARFELAYLDRARKALVRLPLERMRVPYHRVRAVWRDGRLIWSRGAAPGKLSRRTELAG